MNNPVHSGLLVLELSKISIFEFWYDYIKRKCGEKAKYMNILCFIVYMKTDDIYKDIAEDVGTRFDTSSYELDIPLKNIKNKKVIGLMKDES